MKRILCLVCAWSICCLLVHETMAGVIHSGTYTYSVAPSAAISGYSGDVGNAGPIAYTSSSILGDNTQGGLSTACWNNGSNALGSGGVTITFDLETEYNIGEVNVKCGLANSYWCVGAVYFRYSTDGVIYTDLGSDGSREYGPGVLTRSYSYGGVAARYIQVQVCSNHWYNLGVSDVEIQDAIPEAPVFTPNGDEFISGPTEVVITTETDGATIYYTTDGTPPATSPTCGSFLDSGTVTVNPGTTLKAIAVLNGFSSSVTSETYYALTVVDGRTDRLDTTANEDSFDFVMQNGSVHINGDVYRRFVLSGTVTNWTGYYNSSTWAGTWGAITMMGTDYFIGRNVPTDIDETMTSIYSYLGDTDYGDVAKQCGYAANAGLVVCKWSSGLPIFAAEDCNIYTPAGHKVDLYPGLFDWTQYEFQMVYDLDAMTVTVNLKDVGDSDWDTSRTIDIGLRNDVNLLTDNTNDDWSDLVFSIQMANSFSMSETTETYGFDYDIKLEVGNMISGDANCDGVVNVGDLGILAANYSGTGKGWNQGDFNHDGVVNVGDLGILAANYGVGVNGASDFASDYAKVFGTAVAEEEEPEEELDTTLCGALGLPLVAGLVLMSLMLVKLEE